MFENKKYVPFWRTSIYENENDSCSSEDGLSGFWQPTISILTFNARSLLDLNRRTKFSNSLNTHDFDLICRTENWLTKDIPSSKLFHHNYLIYRNDRKKISVDRKCKHGDVLIAVKMKTSQQYIELRIENSDFISPKILTKTGSEILICNINNSPYPSPYQGEKWNASAPWYSSWSSSWKSLRYSDNKGWPKFFTNKLALYVVKNWFGKRAIRKTNWP